MNISTTPQRSQSGLATLLIVIVIGMLLTVTTLGVVYSGRSAQEKQVAVHAVTHAQAGVMVGQEVFRKYLESLSFTDRVKLAASEKIELTTGANVYSITIVEPLNADSEIKANISYRDAHAKSSSQIQTVISIADFEAPPIKSADGIDVYGDLTIQGDVTAEVPIGISKLTVDGEVNFNGVDLSELKEIRASQTIRAGSSVDLEYMWSNEDIVLTGGAVVGEANALGNIVLTGNGGIKTGLANGFISSGSSNSAAAGEPAYNLTALGLDLNYDQIGTSLVSVCLNATSPCNNIETNQVLGETFVAKFTGSPTLGTVIAHGNVMTNQGTYTKLHAGQTEEICKNGTGAVVLCSSADKVTSENGNRYGNVTGTPNLLGAVDLFGNPTGVAKVASELLAYGDVSIINGFSGNVMSYGDAYVNGADAASTVKAEGNIFTSGGASNNIEAKGNVGVSGTAVGDIRSGGSVAVLGYDNIDDIVANGSVSAPTHWGAGTMIDAGGAISGANNATKVISPFNHPPVADLTAVVDQPTPLIPYEISPKPYVDMWLLEDQSNFAFRAEKKAGNVDIKVTVTDVVVNGAQIDQETYYMVTEAGKGALGGKKIEYLCKENNYNNGNCKGTAHQKLPICVTGSGQGCINADVYNDGSVEWTFGYSGGDGGQASIPGVYWFEGDVNLKTSRLNASILATKNLDTAGSMKVKSLNYSSYSDVCENKQSEHNQIFKLIDGSYPANFCDTAKKIITPSTVGNVALGAGGRNPSETDYVLPNGDKVGYYKGGDVTITASSEIWGAVLVGNEIRTGGHVIIHGYFIALGWNDDPNHVEQPNLLGAKLEIIYDITEIAKTEFTRIIPAAETLCADGTSGEACNYVDTKPKTGNGVPKAKVLWSRYL